MRTDGTSRVLGRPGQVDGRGIVRVEGRCDARARWVELLPTYQALDG